MSDNGWTQIGPHTSNRNASRFIPLGPTASSFDPDYVDFQLLLSDDNPFYLSDTEPLSLSVDTRF